MRSLARLGGVTAIVGTVVLFVSTLLHPLADQPAFLVMKGWDADEFTSQSVRS